MGVDGGRIVVIGQVTSEKVTEISAPSGVSDIARGISDTPRGQVYRERQACANDYVGIFTY